MVSTPKVKQVKRQPLYTKLPENSIVPNEDIKHVHKNHWKEYNGFNVDFTATTTDVNETSLQQGDTSIKRSNVSNVITDSDIGHLKGEGVSGGFGLAIKDKDSIVAERSEGNVDYRNKQEVKEVLKEIGLVQIKK